MTRAPARSASSAAYALVATGRVDPFVPPAPAAAAGGAQRATRRRRPYMYTCRLGGRR